MTNQDKPDKPAAAPVTRDEGQPMWTVAADDDREGYWKFDNEEAAITFAHFDHQLVGGTFVVMRHDPDGVAHLIAEFVR